MIIADIGACVGTFIDECLKKYESEDPMIFAFEPMPANYKKLEQRFGESEKVVVSDIAIFNEDGISNFYLKKQAKTNNTDYIGCAGSSLCKDKHGLGTSPSIEVYTMSVLTLFATLKENYDVSYIDLMKLDVEGSEYEVLNHILDLDLHKRIGKIYFEDHKRKVTSENFKTLREKFRTKVQEMGIRDMFYVEGDDYVYRPMTEDF